MSDTRKNCPPGYHRHGTGCVRVTNANKTQRLRSLTKKIPRIKSISRKVCPPGMIERRPYVRGFTSSVRRRGYLVTKKTGKTYRVFPKGAPTYVKAKCIKDLGLAGKGPKKAIGALRKGELKKHGYSSRGTEAQRHAALYKGIKEVGALGVYRKLMAVANYTVRTQPEKSRIYKADSEWVHSKIGKLPAL